MQKKSTYSIKKQQLLLQTNSIHKSRKKTSCSFLFSKLFIKFDGQIDKEKFDEINSMRDVYGVNFVIPEHSSFATVIGAAIRGAGGGEG